MRSEEEIKGLLAEIAGKIDVVAKRRLDRDRLAGTLGMLAALEWVLGQRENSLVLVEFSRAELAAAVRHANR